MFVDELKAKLKIEDICSFSVTVFDNKYAVVEGVKKVVFKGDEEVKFRSKKRGIIVKGKGLKLKEIGEGNAIVSGEVFGVEYD